MLLPPPSARETRSPGVRRIPMGGSDWLCEFALRLASGPAGAASWAGSRVGEGIGRLLDRPILARAARFLVLAVDHHLQAQRSLDALYAGWEWS
jgi:hypothetical protein